MRDVSFMRKASPPPRPSEELRDVPRCPGGDVPELPELSPGDHGTDTSGSSRLEIPEFGKRKRP